MEKVKGMDLLDYLFSIKSMMEQEVIVIVKQIIKALCHLNSLELCHRDIKLENIMIDPETKSIKLIDFGFSSFYQPNKQMTTQVGTPYYISPQILKGEYGKEWDMWSLGIVTFILLTGFPPFRSNNLNEIYRTIISDEIEYQRKVWKNKSSEALNFVQSWLRYNPEERLTPIDALNHPWITQKEESKAYVDYTLYSKWISNKYHTAKLINYRSPEGLRKEIFNILGT